MLDSIYHMTLKLLKNLTAGVKNLRSQRCDGRHFIMLPKSENHLWFIDFNARPYYTPRCDIV